MASESTHPLFNNWLNAVPLQRIEARVPLFWILQAVGWTAYGLFRCIVDPSFFRIGIVYLAVGFAISSFLIHPVYKQVWKKSPTFLYIGLISVAGSILGGFLYLLIAKFVFVSVGIGSYPDAPWYMHAFTALKNSFVHNKTFVFLSWSGLYFGIKYWRDVLIERENARQSNMLAHEAQLEMLRYQLNPHFLFNSLNSIQALVRENPDGAEKMLDELSGFLRYSLLHNKVFETSLAEEINVARNYLDIEKIRFEELLEVRTEIEPDVENFIVPSFLIHPLLENAIKYGMQTSGMPLDIELTAKRKNDIVCIRVVNSGRFIKSNGNDESVITMHGTGVGLENVRRRLETAFPGRHSFEIFERDNRVYAEIEIIDQTNN